MPPMAIITPRKRKSVCYLNKFIYKYIRTSDVLPQPQFQTIWENNSSAINKQASIKAMHDQDNWFRHILVAEMIRKENRISPV